ncbi:hypothetical protein FA10DRAFT_281946 [Acaromyces ingoldii]|uniref:F-box domain-containing protein n=1 Tax=Acaromyces ingoldii TaxID=215250 RepID=A0A316YEA5_9BASI|nr:hypothetical protein FA10DRAFT_281946 [Acaromyces ingoldii]PWN87194.1 hypothetical protein FA10DRAFT_281946 [Acaromyces ingoldii]
MRQPASIGSLPAEALLDVFSHLDGLSLQRAASTCRGLRRWATHDALWRRLTEHHLAASPPAKSHNVSAIVDAPLPWDAAFGLVSSDLSPATRDHWPVTMADVDAEAEYGPEFEPGPSAGTAARFEGARGYHEVWLRFVRPMDRLLGWWASDAPSWGMVIRIVFDPCLPLSDEEGGDGDGDDKSRRTTPAFVCERVQAVNRLHGMGKRGRGRDRGRGRGGHPSTTTTSSSVNGNSTDTSTEDARDAGWAAVNSFPFVERTRPAEDIHEWFHSVEISSQGTTLEGQISVDVAFVGVKTERLWAARWCDVQAAGAQTRSSDVVRRDWKGGGGGGKKTGYKAQGDGGATTVAQRASRLAREMVFGSSVRNDDDYDDDVVPIDEGEEQHDDGFENEAEEEEELEQHGEEVVNVGVLRPRTRGGDAPMSQQHGQVRHVVYPSSGAILTCPSSSPSSSFSKNKRVELRIHRRRPYREANHHRPGGPRALVMPQHPSDFPPPALLPALRDLERGNETAAAAARRPPHERFLVDGPDVEVDALVMSPAPPYRPWPHLAHPLLHGPLFYPIANPPRRPIRPLSRRIAPSAGTATSMDGGRGQHRGQGQGQGERERYMHVAPPRRLDPACDEFDWDSLEGLFAMSYGPWGLETIYLRSRLLTPDDFEEPAADDELDNSFLQTKKQNTNNSSYSKNPTRDDDNRNGGSFWDFEPRLRPPELRRLLGQNAARAIARRDPPTRVIEGIKVTGDANVPRGTVSFRAFVLGPHGDFGFGDGRGDVHSEWRAPLGDGFRTWTPWPLAGPSERQGSYQHSQHQQHLGGVRGAIAPGRLLRAVGRLAREGFADASWTTAMVKINSPDEVQICWNSLAKVSIAKRLTAC